MNIATVKPGEDMSRDVPREWWDRYYVNPEVGWRVQYDYRTSSGELFTCVANTLKDARAKRDAWMEQDSRKKDIQP